MDLITIFFIGLTAGGVGCVVLQGGLLASAITARKEVDKEDKNDILPTLSFLISKLLVYALLGFILGFFGQTLFISDSLRIILQFGAGVYMIIVALSLFDVHPLFRHFIIQPPRFLTRLVKNQSKSADMFGPGILGAMTIFIPCGTTLAMEALAISSGSPFKGALILIAFVLGTFPIFFGLGYITAKLSDSFRQTFFKIVAVIIILVGFSTIYNSWGSAGLPIIVWNTEENLQTNDTEVKQDYEIQILNSGYSPNYLKVKKGLPVKLTLVSNSIHSCSLAFRIPSLRTGKNLKPTDSQVLEFTPAEAGIIPFSCSMGMYRGIIEVVE